MSKSTHLMTWVTWETKDCFAHLAREQGYSESAFLKRLVDGALVASGGMARQLPERVEPTVASGRLSIRLRSDDLLVLRERAAGRDMPTSTYVPLLIRAHLRSLTPLPTSELIALRRSVAEIGAIGRNLNQIARAVNRGEAPTGPNRADLQALLRALTGLRDHFKAVITANLESWSIGYEKAAR